MPLDQSLPARGVRRRGPLGTIRRLYLGHESMLLPLATFVIFLAAWEVGAIVGALDSFFFSSPSAIVAAGIVEMQLPRFWNDVFVSSSEFFIGYFLAVAVALPFGLLTGWFRRLHYWFDPWLSAFNATPRLALLPLVILWVGLGLWSKIVIVFLGVFFPVAINTFQGVRTVNRDLIEVSKTFGASIFMRLRSVVMPATLPFALVGMRVGIGRAVSGVIVAEFFTSQVGLGNMILRAGQRYEIDRLLFGALFITLLALLAFRGLSLIERRLTAWRPRVGSA